MTVAISCCLWRFPISDRDPDCMEKLGYTDTETLLWDYSETELYHVLVIPPARARRTLYRITAEYAFQWFGLNGQNNLTVVYYPFSRINFRNLTDPCICPPEVDAFAATVSVSPLSVYEGDGIPLVFTIRLDRISASDATIDFTLAGSAIEGVDYATVTPHSVTITAGTLTALVTINPILDVLFESTESVSLTLTSGVSGPGLIDVTGAIATGFIIETVVTPPLPAWQRPLSVAPDAPIWWHARADASSTNNRVWFAAAANVASCDLYYDNVVLVASFETSEASGLNYTEQSGFHANVVFSSPVGVDAGSQSNVSSTLYEYGLSSARSNNTTAATLLDDENWDLSDTNLAEFTIEYSYNQPNRTDNYNPFNRLQDIGNFGWSVRHTGANWDFFYSPNGTDINSTQATGAVGAINTWTKYAITKNSAGLVQMYVNGTRVMSATPANSIMFRSSKPLSVNNGGISQTSYLDNARITKGICRYTGTSYAVTTAAFPTQSCSTACDDFLSFNKLLLGFEGADASTGAPGLTDESASARGTATAVGNAQIDTAQFKFGTSSLLVDGAGDAITFPDSADWQFDGQFTIECWVRPNTLPVVGIIAGHGTSSIAYGWYLNSTNGGTIRFRFDDSGNATPEHDLNSTASGGAGVVLAVGKWTHIAVDRDGAGTMRLYGNGDMLDSKASATGTSFNSTGALNIGYLGGSLPFDGWIDEFRITKGVARYAVNNGFVRPIRAFPRIACAPTACDAYLSNVVLLMGFEGADAATGAPGMVDESTANNKGIATVIADAQIDTAQFKFGTSSLLLDGTGDGLTWTDSADYNLAAGLFTIECWIRTATIVGTHFIVGQWFTAPNLGWVLDHNAGQLGFAVSVTGSDTFADVVSASLLSVNTWYAVAIDFDGTKYRMYLDGTMVASSTTLRTINNSTLRLAVGSASLGGFNYNGNIDEMRITKGVARYASDSGYTVATTAFSRAVCTSPTCLWRTSFTSVFNADNPGWDGYNFRQVLSSSVTSVLAFRGSRVRVTLEASAAAGGFTIDHAEIGHQATFGDVYDFNGTQVPLTFSGGSAGVTVAQGNTVLSDEITYDFDRTKPFVLAFHFTGASSLRSESAIANVSGYYKLAANEVSVSNVSSYITLADGLALVKMVEVYDCNPVSTDTWNPSDKSASIALSNGNRTATATANGGVRTVGSHASGKYYFEFTLGTFTGNIFDIDGIGITTGTEVLTAIAGGPNTLWVREDGLKIVGGVSTGVSVNHIGGLAGGVNVVSFAINLDTKRAWIRNQFNGNAWSGPDASPADPVTGLNGIDVSGIFGLGVAVFPCITGDNTTTDIVTFNQIFTYTVPTGFNAW